MIPNNFSSTVGANFKAFLVKERGSFVFYCNDTDCLTFQCPLPCLTRKIMKELVILVHQLHFPNSAQLFVKMALLSLKAVPAK